jgi:hypothetical protein
LVSPRVRLALEQLKLQGLRSGGFSDLCGIR